MLHRLPFEVMRRDGFVFGTTTPYMTYYPTLYKRRGRGRQEVGLPLGRPQPAYFAGQNNLQE